MKYKEDVVDASRTLRRYEVGDDLDEGMQQIMQHKRTLQIPFSVQGLAILNTFKCTIQNRFCVASSDSCFKFKNVKGNRQSS